MIYKIVRLSFNALTADNKHYLLNRDNLKQPIQMQLSQKQKTFADFFYAFLKSILNFTHFAKKDGLYNWCLSGIKGSEKRG